MGRVDDVNRYMEEALKEIPRLAISGREFCRGPISR